MKRIAIFSLALILAFSFAGCRRNTEPEATTPPETTVPTTEPMPTIIPTVPNDIGPNIPDESVDDGTLEDMIPDGTQASDPESRARVFH